MLTRYAYPVLISIAGLIVFLSPFASSHKNSLESASAKSYTGSNTIRFESDQLPVEKITSVEAEVLHSNELFYLNLWIGAGHDNRIAFVLKNENITARAYELDHPAERYLSFVYRGKECTFSSDENYTGMLMIHRYDTIHKIIAGSFEFMAHADECDELIRVTNGTFDVRYLPD